MIFKLCINIIFYPILDGLLSFWLAHLKATHTEAEADGKQVLKLTMDLNCTYCTGGQGVCHVAICHTRSEPTLPKTAESAGIKKTRSASTPSKEFTVGTVLPYRPIAQCHIRNIRKLHKLFSNGRHVEVEVYM
jgi:hypothetical protein